MTAPSRTWPMTQSPPSSTEASMASASSPVGVRLCETCNAAGGMPAPVRASVTCAVAGFGDPAASLPRASVTVFRTASVAAASGFAADCPAVGAAGGPAEGASAVTGLVAVPASDEAAVVGSDVPGWTPGGTPPTHPDRASARAVPATAGTRRRAAWPNAEGAADDAPAIWFCRWSGVVRMVSFCHVVRQRVHNLGGQGAAGGCRGPARPGNQGER